MNYKKLEKHWMNVSKKRPCEICGKPDWCSYSSNENASICRRIEGGVKKIDKSGSEYWLYPNKDHSRIYPNSLRKRTTTHPIKNGPKCADNNFLHEVYSSILEVLTLSKNHEFNLTEHRKIPKEEVAKRSYRTLDKHSKSLILQHIQEKYSLEQMTKVPGFYINENELDMACFYGLIIPVRSLEGKIIALKVRTEGQGKYLWLSSKSKGGEGSGSHIHFPLNDYKNIQELRVTEGELKADIATIYSKEPTISIPGVNSWKKVIPVIETLRPKLIKVAFDKDFNEKRVVAINLVRFCEYLEQNNINFNVEIWE